MKVSDAEVPLCSVRVTPATSKRMIVVAMNQISQARLEAPVRIWQAVIHNILGPGSDVINTKSKNRVMPQSRNNGEVNY